MADGVCIVVYPKVFGRSCHLLLNKLFDQSIPSMRKVDDGEKEKAAKKEEEKRMVKLAVH